MMGHGILVQHKFKMDFFKWYCLGLYIKLFLKWEIILIKLPKQKNINSQKPIQIGL